MHFKIGDVGIFLPPLHITMIAIIVIFLLVKWSKELETRRYTVFVYFLISAIIVPVFSYNTAGGVFELWVPLGFILVFFYLFRSKRNHRSKMKASILGCCVAIYQIILQYSG